MVKLLQMLWTQERTTFHGKYYDVEDGLSAPKPVQKPHPPFYMVGTSEMARSISAEIAEAHLMQCDTIEAVKEAVDDIAGRAAKLGRTIRFGVRAQVVTRETEKEAWDAVKEMMSQVDQRVLADRSANYAKMDKTERVDLVARAIDSHMIGPNVWGGMHLVRSGAGTVFVGSHEQVADTCLRYIDIGIGAFILSGYPMAREGKRFGEKVLPIVEERLKARVEAGTS
jgi:alkanesulfonate monooxygenase